MSQTDIFSSSPKHSTVASAELCHGLQLQLAFYTIVHGYIDRFTIVASYRHKVFLAVLYLEYFNNPVAAGCIN